MKLRSVAVNQFRKFTAPTRLDGIGDGLNILIGPNEMGKSTLLDAIGAVFFERHGSAAKPIRALQNDRNRAAPVVHVDFELEDGPYRIEKRFLKKPYARLHCPDGRQLEGGEAEHALRKRLSFEQSGPHGANPETRGIWSVLWVRQGDSLGSVAVTAQARASLYQALEAEVGDVLGGNRGANVVSALEEQLAALISPQQRRLRNEYATAVERVTATEAMLADLRGQRDEVSAILDELDRRSAELASLESKDGVEEEQLEAQLEAARREHTEAARLEERIKAARAEAELRGRDLADAESNLKRRAALRTAVAEARRDSETAEGELAAAQSAVDAVEANVSGLRGAVANARTAADEAALAESRAGRVLNAVVRGDARAVLRARHRRATAAAERRRSAELEAVAIPLTSEVLEGLRQAARRVETVAALRNAAATTVALEASPERLIGVTRDGTPLGDGGARFRALAPTILTIPDWGRITIEPAVRDLETLDQQSREALTAQAAALDAVGVADMSEAETRFWQREAALAEVARAEHELADRAPDGLEELARQVREADGAAARVLGSGDVEPPSVAEAERLVAEKRQAAEEARQKQAEANAALAGPQESLEERRTELGATKQRAEAAAGLWRQRQAELAGAEAKRTDADIEEAVRGARRACEERAGVVERLESSVTGDSVAVLEARIQRLTKIRAERRSERDRLRQEIARLEARAEERHAVQVHEEIGERERSLEQDRATVANFEKEVQILTLLVDTLRSAENAAKERFVTPVVSRVRPYLRALFPGADIVVDEDLSIAKLRRDPEHAEPYHQLSMGTREQVTVLVRLAFAQLLAEQGRPASVILDDSLAFSDDQRLDRFFDVLTSAAQTVQILVLTCREQLFRGLGARRLHLTPGDPEELASA